MKSYKKDFVLGVIKQEKDKRLDRLYDAQVKATKKTPLKGRQVEIDKIKRRQMEVRAFYSAICKRFERE